jgi:drug/metabolite transporter (DMT)-like permease
VSNPEQMASYQRPWIAYLCLLAGMLLVGSYVGLSKPLTAAIPVFILATLRFALAAIMMLPWTFPWLPLSRTVWSTLFVQSLFGNFLFSICMLYGVAFSSAVAAGVIMSTLPAMVALLSRIVLKERLTNQTIVAIAISVLGILVLQWASQQATPQTQTVQAIAAQAGPLSATSASTVNSSVVHLSSALLGNFLLFCAVVCEAIYVVTSKRLSRSLSPKCNSALVNLVGLGLMLPFGIWQLLMTPSFSPLRLETGTWGLLLFYAFAASVGSTWLWMTGLKKVPASQAGVFTIGLPIAAVTVGVLLLKEPVTVFHGVAFACCFVALLLVTLQRLPSLKQG